MTIIRPGGYIHPLSPPTTITHTTNTPLPTHTHTTPFTHIPPSPSPGRKRDQFGVGLQRGDVNTVDGAWVLIELEGGDVNGGGGRMRCQCN